MKKNKIIGIVITTLILLVFNQSINAQRNRTFVDEFDGTITTYTPSFYPIGLCKKVSINDNTSLVFLTLETVAENCVVNGIGAYVIFYDGTRWSNKLVKVECDVNENSNVFKFKYNVLCVLNKSELELFKTKKIRKFKIGIFQKDIQLEDAKKYKKHITEVAVMGEY